MNHVALTVAATLIVAFCAAADTTVFTMNATELALYENNAPVFVYRYHDVPRKPYLMEWYTPKGINILRDAPHDHLHHHGLMYAIKVNDVNYWEETDSGGYQIHDRFSDVRLAPDGATHSAGFVEYLHWRGPDATAPSLLERRSVHHSPLSDDTVRVLTWESELRPPDTDNDTVTLSGRIYHGLGMRFPEFMDGIGAVVMADDKTDAFEDGANHYLAQASWCAYTVVHDETPVTVAMFHCPENPRPTLWFTMRQPFAYLSGTQDLMREPMTLQADQPVTMRYGVAAWDAVVDKATINALYNLWLARLQSHEAPAS